MRYNVLDSNKTFLGVFDSTDGDAHEVVLQNAKLVYPDADSLEENTQEDHPSRR